MGNKRGTYARTPAQKIAKLAQRTVREYDARIEDLKADIVRLSVELDQIKKARAATLRLTGEPDPDAVPRPAVSVHQALADRAPPRELTPYRKMILDAVRTNPGLRNHEIALIVATKMNQASDDKALHSCGETLRNMVKTNRLSKVGSAYYATPETAQAAQTPDDPSPTTGARPWPSPKKLRRSTRFGSARRSR